MKDIVGELLLWVSWRFSDELISGSRTQYWWGGFGEFLIPNSYFLILFYSVPF